MAAEYPHWLRSDEVLTGNYNKTFTFYRKDNLSMTVDKFGFGFSQILPLVFARSRYSHLILIEQPELHLHPKSQSRLADFFVFRIDTTLSDIKTWATEYIVENTVKVVQNFHTKMLAK